MIPIRGVIDQHAHPLYELLGIDGASVDSIRRSLRAALADPEVSSILLDVDSPGGSVFGIAELAAEIREAREQKPIVGFSNAVAGSAAYYLVSQATELVVTPSGAVGSIGVIYVHQEFSELLEKEGIKVTVISAGEHKADGNMYEPLSEEARANIEAKTQTYYRAFVADVAKGRGVSTATVEADFGQGRMVLAREAVSAGMADAVGTMDDALRRAARPRGGMRSEGEPHGDHMIAEAGPEYPQPGFSERLDALAEEAEDFAAHIARRIDMREHEGRPAFTDQQVASLESLRDAITNVLATGSAQAPDQAGSPPTRPEPPARTPVAPEARNERWAAKPKKGWKPR